MDRDGTVWRYRAPRQGRGAAETGIGAFLTGMVSVGIGETVMPQLVNFTPEPCSGAGRRGDLGPRGDRNRRLRFDPSRMSRR